MRRRPFVTFLAAGAAAAAIPWPYSVTAQQPSKPAMVAILDPGVPGQFAAFREGMLGLGYIEGSNISYAYRSADGKAEAIPQLADELVGLRPDVIVTNSAPAVLSVEKATATIPIVFVLPDAVAVGAINSLSHPGGNATGVSHLNTELSAKRVELLHEMLPKMSRLAVLLDQRVPANFRTATEEAGQILGIEVQMLEVGQPDTYESAFATAVSGGADALVVPASVFFVANKERLVELAAKYRLPAIYQLSLSSRPAGWPPTVQTFPTSIAGPPLMWIKS
jgi:putative ABC transport system substrate-binding protein